MESRTGLSGGECASPADPPAVDAGTAEDGAGTWSPRARNRPTRQRSPSSGSATGAAQSAARNRSRAVLAAAIAASALAAVYALCSVGPVRTLLRQSFSQLSSPSIQFYLNGDPWVSGELLNVPLGILLNASGRGSYTVHLWTVDGTGKTDSSGTVTVPVRNGVGTVNASLTIPAGGQVLWAQVEGTPLSLHYRFAGSAFATANSSS